MRSSFAVPSDTVATARELQERVARLAWTSLVLVLVMGVASVGAHLATERRLSESGSVVHELLHGAALLPALVVWLRCRGPAMSLAVVELLDAALTLSACTLYALLGWSASTSLSVTFSIVLAMTYTLVGRSIIVPSSLRRTLWISSAGALPTAVYFATQGVSAAFALSPQSRQLFSGWGMLWCVFAVVAAAANSRQLYGLRAQIREIGKLGQYTLDHLIGEGGMGQVFRATHAMLRRPAAIKLLSKDRASEKDQARFEREVQLTSRLAHPNTISIFDYGRTADGVFYYVMEYLDGVDLDRLVKAEGALPPARVIHILVQVCGALAEAHALGLIHRDIKPANVMLTERVDAPDVVKVVDFGLVKTLDQSDGDSRNDVITGTPLYLAPEAISAPETVDGRADLYALGAVAYFLLSGRNVFESDTVVATLGMHLLAEPTRPSVHLPQPLPSDLEAVVMRCLAKDRGARPASAGELGAALLACEAAAHYDREAASRWWRERGPTLRTGTAFAAPRSPATMATMAVDLSGRNAAAPIARPR